MRLRLATDMPRALARLAMIAAGRAIWPPFGMALRRAIRLTDMLPVEPIEIAEAQAALRRGRSIAQGAACWIARR